MYVHVPLVVRNGNWKMHSFFFWSVAHSRGEHDLNLVKVPPIDPQDADKSMLL